MKTISSNNFFTIQGPNNDMLWDSSPPNFDSEVRSIESFPEFICLFCQQNISFLSLYYFRAMKEMSVGDAFKKWKSLILREKKIQEKKRAIRAFLIEKGVDLDGSQKRAERTEKMFTLFDEGLSNKEIAKQVDLGVGRVQQYRMRFERDRPK